MGAVPRHSPNLLTVGQILRSFRVEKGWTQERLSLKSGLTTGFISDGELGKRNLSFISMERWLAALGVGWDEFGQALDRVAAPKTRQ
jgi:transcriptional regulator with XRE-family HTH domain